MQKKKHSAQSTQYDQHYNFEANTENRCLTHAPENHSARQPCLQVPNLVTPTCSSAGVHIKERVETQKLRI